MARYHIATCKRDDSLFHKILNELQLFSNATAINSFLQMGLIPPRF